MAGAAGLMTLAMMTRATLGHTGQKLHAGSATVAIYLLLVCAVLARIMAAIWIGAMMPLFTLSAIMWVSAFAGFAIAYGPCLVKPKPARG